MEELLSPIPEEVRLRSLLAIPAPKSEFSLLKELKELARRASSSDISFLGAGSYRRFIPAVVPALASRAEFLTSYTPYQPEISQGTLRVMFEFQTLLSQLTGMDVANASMYEGASASAEAVLMAGRIHRKGKRILISEGVHPEYLETIQTYIRHLDLEIIKIPLTKKGQTDLDTLKKYLNQETLCICIQMINFYGVIEQMPQIGDLLQSEAALNIAILPEMSSLGLITPPGELQVDIFVGEGQSLGLPTSFGGPNLGILACRQKYLRQIPGRLAGETVDKDGNQAYCLTLAAREQHIRRERATSNICSNQALCALMVSVYLALLGKKGIRGLAIQNLSITNYALNEIKKLPTYSIRYDGPVYNEFVVELPLESELFTEKIRQKGVQAGVKLSRFFPEDRHSVLLNFTELNTKAEIDQLLAAMQEILL